MFRDTHSTFRRVQIALYAVFAIIATIVLQQRGYQFAYAFLAVAGVMVAFELYKLYVPLEITHTHIIFWRWGKFKLPLSDIKDYQFDELSNNLLLIEDIHNNTYEIRYNDSKLKEALKQALPNKGNPK